MRHADPLTVVLEGPERAGMTAPEDPRARFRALPDPVHPEDTVESLDTSTFPETDESEDRARMLREAGGA